MFPNLAARETYVAETNFAARKQKMFLPGVKNIFASRTHMLCLRNIIIFPSLATPGNVTRNIVSVTMFLSLISHAFKELTTTATRTSRHKFAYLTTKTQ